MELRQLEYFQVIASFQNLTKAAEALHITQPALSRILKRLEEDVGFALFERRSSRLELTEAGRVFLDAVSTSLGALHKGLDECRRLLSEGEGDLSVACFYEGSMFNPFSAFHERYPHVRLQYFLYPIDAMQNGLLSQELELALAPDRFSSGDIDWEPLIDEELLLLLPDARPDGVRRTLPLKDVDRVSFVFNTAVYARESFEQVCAEHGLSPKILFQSNEHTVISGFMNAGQPGALFLPASYFFDMLRSEGGAAPKNKPLPVRVDPPVFRRRIGVATLKNRPLSPAAASFRLYITDYFRELEKELKAFLEREYR